MYLVKKLPTLPLCSNTIYFEVSSSTCLKLYSLRSSELLTLVLVGCLRTLLYVSNTNLKTLNEHENLHGNHQSDPDRTMMRLIIDRWFIWLARTAQNTVRNRQEDKQTRKLELKLMFR